MNLGDTIRGGSSGGPRAREFRATHGVLFAQAGADFKGLGRNARGHYTTFQNELYNINLGLAIQLQDLMVERLRDSLVPSRRAVSSGRLARALGDRRNRVVNNGGFGVGVPSWLDKSEAKYWRAIEVGTDQFVGNKLPFGVWGGTLTGEYGGKSKYGPYPLAGEPFTATGTNRAGRLRPMGKTYAYRALVESGMARRAAYKASRQRAIITKPIEPHYFMKGAWADFNPRARVTRAVREALRASGIT